MLISQLILHSQHSLTLPMVRINFFTMMLLTNAYLFNPVSLFLTANDYISRMEVVLIPPGEDSIMVEVTIIEDEIIEGSEVFFGVIAAEDVFTSVIGGMANVTIIDNDGEYT